MFTSIKRWIRQGIEKDARKRYASSTARLEEILTDVSPGRDISDVMSLISKDEYSPYRGVYKRMNTMLQTFEIPYDQEKVEHKVSIFSVWLKALDNVIESGDIEKASALIDQLHKPADYGQDHNLKIISDPLAFLTEALKHQIEPKTYNQVVTEITLLSSLMQNEKHFDNMHKYIEYRNKVNVLVADIIYHMILPDLRAESEQFIEFSRSAAIFAGLFDTILDIKEDVKDGVFASKPCMKEMAHLYGYAFTEFGRLIVNYPQFIPEYLQGIRRNVIHMINACDK